MFFSRVPSTSSSESHAIFARFFLVWLSRYFWFFTLISSRGQHFAHLTFERVISFPLSIDGELQRREGHVKPNGVLCEAVGSCLPMSGSRRSLHDLIPTPIQAMLTRCLASYLNFHAMSLAQSTLYSPDSVENFQKRLVLSTSSWQEFVLTMLWLYF